MIDPVIFTIELFGREFSLRWYGVIVMVGVIVGSLMVEQALKRHGENSEAIWDVLVWVLPAGIIGARLWFVVNATLGGDTRFSNDPAEIFRVWNGGLHIFGGLLLGAAALLLYLRQHKLDIWLFLDAAGPAMLVGQGIGRVANFINQELYGPPTTLPWGIPIDSAHRLTEFQTLPADTRFHPTFAYELLWNFAAAGLLLWLARRYEKELKPGTLFSGWLILAGLGRTWIEFFRPDQPKIGDSVVSYSMIVAAAMAIAGAVMLMARYKVIRLGAAEEWEEAYKISTQPQPEEQPEESVEMEEEEEAPRPKRSSNLKAGSAVRKKPAKAAAKKPAAKTKKSAK